jgi:hypothetical protein
VEDWQSASSVYQYVLDAADYARIDPWGGKLPPLTICESRATKGVLRRIAQAYLVPITATNGQSGGFIVTDLVPLLKGNDRHVLYIGDYELRGPADQIEANTRRYLEEHTGRSFEGEWTKIALTDQQVKRNKRLLDLTITKFDNRCKPARSYQAVECEAVGQKVLETIFRKVLDKMLPEPLADVRQREQEQRNRLANQLRRMKR